jgi:hypothetical protein
MTLWTATKVSAAIIGSGLAITGFIALWLWAMEKADDDKWYGFAVLIFVAFVGLTGFIWLIGQGAS